MRAEKVNTPKSPQFDSVPALSAIEDLKEARKELSENVAKSRKRTNDSYRAWQEDSKQVKNLEAEVDVLESELKTLIYCRIINGDKVELIGHLSSSKNLLCASLDGIPTTVPVDLGLIIDKLSKNNLRITIEKVCKSEFPACSDCKERFTCLTEK